MRKIYSNLSVTEQYPYREYVEFCKLNDKEPQEESSSDYYVWADMMAEDDWQDLLADVKFYDKSNDGVYHINGTLGSWNGSHMVEGKAESLFDAMNLCLSGIAMTEIEIDDDGAMFIYAPHHDGVNTFVIDRRVGNACQPISL